MMKLFHKRHKWQEKETWLGLELEEPKKEAGRVNEGVFYIKIGEEAYQKAGFKLSPDEARALRDALDQGLKDHDKKLRELMNEPARSEWEPRIEEVKEEKKEEPREPSFKLFESKPQKEETEFYY